MLQPDELDSVYTAHNVNQEEDLETEDCSAFNALSDIPSAYLGAEFDKPKLWSGEDIAQCWNTRWDGYGPRGQYWALVCKGLLSVHWRSRA